VDANPDAGSNGFVDVDGASIHYDVCGTGHPIVLIHGWTLDARMWDDQVVELSTRYRVIRYDRRGFGQSTAIPDTTKDPTDLNALLNYLGVQSAYILGMSQGGWGATYFALDYPSRTDALILNAAVLPGLNVPFSQAEHVPSDQYLELAQRNGMSAMHLAWLNHPFFSVARSNPRVWARLTAIVSGYSGHDLAHVKSPAFGDARDAVVRLGTLNMPVLILTGELDITYMKVVADVQAYCIPRSSKVILHGCDHVANMEAPAEFNRAVLRFLADVEQQRGSAPPAE
jgi:3-oxoadipate enol-lactonase